MENFVNENIVMQFYLEEMEKDNIIFLKNHEETKNEIKAIIGQLMVEDKMNYKIQIAGKLWKILFEASMSFISPERQGYDKIFKYFDAYVEFEELIFASDSFYRDHTLHCIWVYFLGEYIRRKEDFKELFVDAESEQNTVEAVNAIMKCPDGKETSSYREMKRATDIFHKINECDEAIRCVTALTHDLGYPLKKVEKINKSIKKVLPYFSINNFKDFSFEYENIQENFVSQFIDFIARSYRVHLDAPKEESEVMKNIFETDKYGNVIGYDKEKINELTDEQRRTFAEKAEVESIFEPILSYRFAYSNDFEDYKHGIMSAFLLCKNLRVFQQVNYNLKENKLNNYMGYPDWRVIAIHTILSSIANHTCDAYKIKNISPDSYLTFIDELEEFSRISRASQNREYVEEFCDTAIYMKDGWLNLDFEFNNDKLDNLDPEISFKGRCKRFLSLFNIADLSPSLKIRVSCIGKLPTDQNTYTLEIGRKHTDIIVNGESINIPKYLKSNQFYTKEEYAAL